MSLLDPLPYVAVPGQNWSCVSEWGNTNTSWHTDVHYVKIFRAYIKCEVKTWGWGILAWMGGAFMAWMGTWHSYGEVSFCFWEIRLRNTSLQGSTLSGHCMTAGSVTLNSWPVAYCRKAGPFPCFKEPSSRLAFTVLWIFKLLNKLGVGLNGWGSLGGVIIILTGGTAEPTCRLLLSSRLVKGGQQKL